MKPMMKTKYWNRYVPEINDWIHEHDKHCTAFLKDGCICNFTSGCKGDVE